MNVDGHFAPEGSPQRIVSQQLRDLHRWGVRVLPRSQVAHVTADDEATTPGTPAPSKPSSPMATGSPGERLAILSQEVAACCACEELCSGRTQTVFGVGNPQARLCFLGEGPGADEDRIGEPFVGRAGKLLDKIIAACTLRRDEVYILNVVKCRPPRNRNPSEDEISNCRQFFERQLEIIQPEFICCLGSVAAKTILESTLSVGRLRGKFFAWRDAQVIVTYHPAYLLRNEAAKKDVWQDMQLLMQAMGVELPPRK